MSGKQIARATGSISGATLLSRILGLVRDMVIARFFGAGLVTDAFFVAFKVPNLLRRLVAEGSLSSAFIPVFTDEQKTSEEASRNAVREATAFSLLLTTALTLFGFIFAEEITEILGVGFGVGTEKSLLAASLLRVMFPYVILVSLLALASSILNVLGVFALPAAAPAILNVTLIAGVVIFSGAFEQPIYALAIAVPVGGLLALLPQLFVLKRLGYPLLPRSPLKSRAVRKLCLLMGPAVLSASVYQIIVFINTVLASMLQEGSVSWLYYADRLFQFPLGVFSIAVGTAALPAFSRLASSGEEAEFRLHLLATLRWITFITVPASFGLIVLSTPLVAAIYEHGTFTRSDTFPTASALCAFSLGLWAISCQTILVRAYLAKKDTKTPALISCAALVLSVFTSFSLMGPVSSGTSGGLAHLINRGQEIFGIFSLGHLGLALTGSIVSYLSVVLLLLGLTRIQTELRLFTLLVCLARSFLSSTVMAFCIGEVIQLNLSFVNTLLISVPGGALIYFVTSFLLQSEEAKTVFREIKKFRQI